MPWIKWFSVMVLNRTYNKHKGSTERVEAGNSFPPPITNSCGAGGLASRLSRYRGRTECSEERTGVCVSCEA
ncbi:UNVERIFIED_CONTAM: hypothetical protein FKN15_064160 [Acipenser sinensis]